MGEEKSQEYSKRSLNDIMLEAKARIEVPPDPRQFRDLPNPDPADLSGNPRQISEKDLPIIKEAEEATAKAAVEGKLVTRPENPMGRIDSVLIYVMGDLHLPATNPRQAVESRSPVLRNTLIETGPKTIAGKLKGKDWYHEERPSVSMDAFMQMEEALVADIGNKTGYGINGNTVLILDLGDRSYNDIGISDTAGIALAFDGMRQKAEAVLKEASGNKNAGVYQAMAKGNHDADMTNFGLQQERAERQLYGAQIFFQEVGNEYGLLVLNTNFSSDYWKRYFDIQKASPIPEEDSEIITQIEKEIKKQEDVIKKAVDSGRKLIVAGHQADQIERLMDLPGSKVERILVGHVDPPEKDKELKIKNKDGINIRRTRVGGSLETVPGWTLKKSKNMQPAGYAIEIKKDSNGSEKVTVSDLPIPGALKDLKYLI